MKKKKWSIPFFVPHFEGIKGAERFEYLVFNFGKYKYKKAKDVVEEDPEYIVWCYDNLENFNLQPHLRSSFVSTVISRLKYHLDKNNVARINTFKNIVNSYFTEEEKEWVIKRIREHNEGKYSDFVL